MTEEPKVRGAKDELGTRMKKLRQLRGLRQNVVAEKMGITPQTYNVIEKGGNLKIGTLQKFCEAINAPLILLLCFDTPISEENLLFFDKLEGQSCISAYRKLEQQVEMYRQLINSRV